MKRWFKIIILVMIWVIGSQWDVPVIAEQIKDYHISTVNPVYEDEIFEKDLNLPKKQAELIPEIYDTTLEDVGSRIREQLIKHEETIVVGYKTQEEPSEELIKKIMDEALKHTGNPKEGDYIKFQIGGYEANISGEIEESLYKLTIKYTMNYFTTLEQEEDVDTFVNSWKNSFGEESVSDYEKISKIYDYICENIKYDYNNLNDESYMLKYTAYAAAIDKTAVCQGYAVLLYRLLLEEGIDCRIISGTGGGEPHAWNSVLLGEKYYYLDSTWDAGKIVYDYFLKGKNNFTDHETEMNQEGINDEDYVFNDEEHIEEIASLKDFQKIKNNPSGHFRLVNDLVISNVNDDAAPFCNVVFNGTLDGDGHTISGVVIPLFDTISATGVVKNINLKVTSNHLVFVQGCYAPLAINNNGKIESCKSEISYNNTGNLMSYSQLGGICTQNNGIILNSDVKTNLIVFSKESFYFGGISAINYKTIKKCTVAGDVKILPNGITTNYVYGGYGGIVGLNNGILSVVDGCTGRLNLNGVLIQAGGVVGNNINGVVKNCENYGNISSIMENDNLYNQVVGGIVGYDENSSIINCKNYGQIHAELKKEGARIISAGGIAGQIETNGSLKGIVVAGCVNQGDISSVERNTSFFYNNYSGGIVGTVTGEIFSTAGDDFDNIVADYQPVNLFFKDCYNYGKLSSNNGNKGTPGGIVGNYNIIEYKESKIVFENCFNTGKLTGTMPVDIMEQPLYGSLEENEFIKLFVINQYYDGIKFYDTNQKDREINPIVFKERELTLHVGEKVNLNFYSAGKNEMEWITSDSILSIQKGSLTAKELGHTVVIAYDKAGNFDYVWVNVVENDITTKIDIHNYSKNNTLINNLCEKLVKYKCVNCGKQYLKHEYKNKHIWDDGIVTKKPTQTETGIKTYRCLKCGNTKEEILKKLPVDSEGATKPSQQGADLIFKNPSVGDTIVSSDKKVVYKVIGRHSVEYMNKNSNKSKVTIPSVITYAGKTYQVTSIAAKTFRNSKKLKKVVIPSTIKKVGKQAFANCKKLKNITIKTSKLKAKSIGDNAFKGINTKATIKVPKKKLKLYKKILKAKGISSSVKFK